MILGLPFWRRERLRGYLTIFTVTNVVGELVGEPNPVSYTHLTLPTNREV